MKNRMQDLDFEQNVAFDKVQEYEFTRAWTVLKTKMRMLFSTIYIKRWNWCPLATI